MSGFVAKIDDVSIAFGMLWTVLPGADRAGAEVRKLASDFRASGYVSLPVEGGRPKIGLLTEAAFLEKGASRTAACSAAGLLSLAFRGQLKNAVFGIQLTKGKAAFIGFVDGYPLIGFDKVVSIEALDDMTAVYLKELSTEQASTVEFFGTAELFAGRIVSPFEKEWFGRAPKKVLSAARMRRAKSRVLLWGMVGLGVVLIGFGSDAYDTYQKEAAKKVVRLPVDINALYSKSAQAYLANVGVPASFVAGEIIQRMSNLPIFHEGWRMQGGSCKTGKQSVSCTVSWLNTDGGTFLSFSKSPLPGIPVYRTEYKEGLNGLATLFDFPISAAHGVTLDRVMSTEWFSINYGTTAQILKNAGLNPLFGKTTIVALPPSPAGTPPITEASVKEPIREGNWTLSGDWMFYSSLTTLPGNMTLESVELGVSGETISMNVTGKYYVKH
jgi:hypothetical protein